jgi:excisionase family DNA binding protein
MTKPTEIPAANYYTIAQVAEMENVIIRTVHHWIEKGWLSAVQIPGLGYIVNETDLQTFLANPRPQRGYPKGKPRK